MDQRYAHSYRELYQRHWWWRAREEAILELLHRNRPQRGYGRILDIGCGDGLLFPRLFEFGEVEGLEPDANAISTDGPYVDRINISPFDETFRPQQRYGLILMLDVLEHLPNPAWAVSRVYSLLEPGGFFLATVPAFQALWTNHDVVNHHFKRYTRGELRQLLSSEGFQIRTDFYSFYWTFPVKLAVRAVEKVFGPGPEVPAIPPQVINSMLWTLCRFERKTIAKLAPPFGSSVFALGVKVSDADRLEGCMRDGDNERGVFKEGHRESHMVVPAIKSKPGASSALASLIQFPDDMFSVEDLLAFDMTSGGIPCEAKC